MLRGIAVVGVCLLAALLVAVAQEGKVDVTVRTGLATRQKIKSPQMPSPH